MRIEKLREKGIFGSIFIKVVKHEHVELLNKWREITQANSAPNAIADAIKLAMKYKEEVPDLKDKIRMLEYVIDNRTRFFGDIKDA